MVLATRCLLASYLGFRVTDVTTMRRNEKQDVLVFNSL